MARWMVAKIPPKAPPRLKPPRRLGMSEANGGIDKNNLYGKFQAHRDAQDRLYVTAAHKALDIPEDNMGPITTTTTSGVTWKEMSVGGVGAIVLAAIVAWLAGNKGTAAPSNQNTVNMPPAVSQPVAPTAAPPAPTSNDLIPIDISVPWSADVGQTSQQSSSSSTVTGAAGASTIPIQQGTGK